MDKIDIIKTKWSDVINIPFPKKDFGSEEMQREVFKQGFKISNIRLMLGRFANKNEINERRRWVMMLPLY